MTDYLQELTAIFRQILNNPSIELTETTTARNIEEWDSLAHIQLIVAIEKHFKLKFTSMEIQNFKNVGEIVAAINRKPAT